MMAGYLRLVVMNALSNKKLSGYGLKKEIEKSTGTWKPSFGSIYPLLEKLLKEGLVFYKSQGRKKIYFLTSEGRKSLPEMNKGKNMLADKMTAAINAFGKVIDPSEKSFIAEVFNSIRQGKIPFEGLNPELGEFRATVYDVYSNNIDRKRIKTVLKNTIKELRSLK